MNSFHTSHNISHSSTNHRSSVLNPNHNDTQCSSSPTTSFEEYATTSTPLERSSTQRQTRRFVIRRFSPISSTTSPSSPSSSCSSANFSPVVGRGAKVRAPQCGNVVILSRRVRQESNSDRHLGYSNASDETMSYDSEDLSHQMVGVHVDDRSNEAWPSMFGVLETPERKRLKVGGNVNASPDFNSTFISPIYGSPPLGPHVLEVKSPPVLKTPKTMRRSLLSSGAVNAPNIHLSSSPMRSFFVKQQNVLNSNENIEHSSPKSSISKKFFGMRFSGSQITRNREACLLPAETSANTLNASTDEPSENNPQTWKSFGDTSSLSNIGTKHAFSNESRLSEDSGISTFFSSTTSANGDEREERAEICANKVVMPPSLVNRTTSSSLYSQVNIETPSKGLSTETYDCHSNESMLTAEIHNSSNRFYRLNPTPFKESIIANANCRVNFVPEQATGPLEAGLYFNINPLLGGTAQKFLSSRSSPQKRKLPQNEAENDEANVPKTRRFSRGILAHGRNVQRKVRKQATATSIGSTETRSPTVIFEEKDDDCTSLISLEQIENLMGHRAELTSIHEFFENHRHILGGESADQVEITKLARQYLTSIPATISTAFAMQRIDNNNNFLTPKFTLSAGLSPSPTNEETILNCAID